jgi:hypothetical protein
MTAATRSKWLDWQPGDENISVSPEQELTKLTKPYSVSFVSSVSGKPQIVSPPEGDPATEDLDPIDDLRPAFVSWLDDRIQLDTEAIAQRIPASRWFSGITVLHRDCCRWMSNKVPPSREQFRLLLWELCIPIVTIHNEEFAANVVFREDVLDRLRSTPKSHPKGTQ